MRVHPVLEWHYREVWAVAFCVVVPGGVGVCWLMGVGKCWGVLRRLIVTSAIVGLG
jgi:hypothetical protein